MSLRFTSHLKTLFAALAVALVMSAACASAAVAETRTISPFGMCSHMLWGYTNAEIDHELDLMKAAGTSWVRIDVSWRDIETSDNTYNTAVLGALDHVVAAAANRNMNVVPVVMEFPDWANGSKGIWAPPTNDATFADFTRYMAARYAGRIKYWELGNEVNESEFWGVSRSASPARYTEFLQKGYAGIKLGDPNALVISAGLAGSDDGYLQEMYDAGARGYFDILGVHTYTQGRSPFAQDLNTPSSTFDGLAIMKSTMESNGDTTKKIWITEAGWQTSNVNYHVTAAQQAQYTYEAFQRVYESFPYVETLFIYGIRNNGTDLNVATDSYGLMTKTYAAKPAYAAYRQAHDTFGTPISTSTQTPPPPTIPVVNAPQTPSVPTVKPATPRPTIKSSKKTVRRKRSVIMTGKVARAASVAVRAASLPTTSGRVRVKLQRRVHGHWRTIRSLTTNSAGRYRARVRFAKRGTFLYRILVARTTTSRAAASRVISVRCR